MGLGIYVVHMQAVKMESLWSFCLGLWVISVFSGPVHMKQKSLVFSVSTYELNELRSYFILKDSSKTDHLLLELCLHLSSNMNRAVSG